MTKRALLLIAVLALAVWVGKFVVYNFVGAALIAYGQTEESRDAAVSFAPTHAEVLAARGRFQLYRVTPPRATEAIDDLKRAVVASPRDYRFWLELGRAYESNGEQARAEQAFQRATELAPKYFEPRWTLANFRLRAGQVEPALGDFKLAMMLSGGSAQRPDQMAALNAYDTVARGAGNDFDVLRRVAPDDSVSQTYLASYLANHSLDAALNLWRRLPSDEPETYRSLLFQLLDLTQRAGRFDDEREVWRRLLKLEGAGGVNDDGNLMTNPGFEQAPWGEKYPLLSDPPTGFDWTLRPHPEVRARRDGSDHHTGAYALHLTFAASMRSEFHEVSQLISVEPSRSYRLRYFVKTALMPSSAAFIEISDAAQPGRFIRRSVVPGGTSDWQEVALDFTTPAATHALRLTIRSPQLVEFSSSQVGELWLDDFRLEKAE